MTGGRGGVSPKLTDDNNSNFGTKVVQNMLIKVLNKDYFLHRAMSYGYFV